MRQRSRQSARTAIDHRPLHCRSRYPRIATNLLPHHHGNGRLRPHRRLQHHRQWSRSPSGRNKGSAITTPSPTTCKPPENTVVHRERPALTAPLDSNTLSSNIEAPP